MESSFLKGAFAVEDVVVALDGQERTWLNPLGVSNQSFMAALVLKSIGVVLLDPIVIGLCRLLRASKLPSREPEPIMKGLEALTWKDGAFLLINQLFETVGTMHWFAFALFEDGVERDLSKVSLGNVIGFLYFVFLIDDLLYYFAHRFMHLPSVYPWCHKHHHRQSMPKRGYFDAANESPIEQFIGLSLVLTAFHITKLISPFGVHAVGIPVFLVLYAMTALLNHTQYDIGFGILGLGYSVRAHEMHHRFPTCNYSQNTMIWDKLLGTFSEYRAGNRTQKQA